MTTAEFNEELERLRNTYGDRHYPDERTKLLWERVAFLSRYQFRQMVSDAISTQAHAPLVSYFSERTAEIREKAWREEKRQNEATAKKFMATLGVDDIRMVCDAIRKRIFGRMDDNQWRQFQLSLDGMDHNRPCHFCEGGVVFVRRDDESDWVYKCRCHEGRARPEDYPEFKPEDHGITIPVTRIGNTIIGRIKNV